MLSLCIAVLWVSTEVSEQSYICAGRGPTGLQHTEDRNGVSSCQEGVLEESSSTRVWDQVLWLLCIWIFFIGFIVDFCCGTERIFLQSLGCYALHVFGAGRSPSDCSFL